MRRLPMAAAVVLLVAGCGGGSPSENKVTVTVTKTPRSTGPETFGASGYIDTPVTKFGGRKGGPCISEDGYDDVSLGAQVTVSSPDGAVIAVGRLGGGRQTRGGYGGSCRFHFTVDAIPVGFPLYSVEVSHRGALTYTQAEIEDGLSFTLGS